MRATVHLLRLAALTALAGLAAAQVPAVSSFTGATAFGSVNNTNQTIGFSFTANSNIVVTGLGVWDASTGDPLTQNHQVGLWDAGGNLLASGTVLTNSPLTGSWRYVTISPVTLNAGQTYFAGSAITNPYTDTFSRVDLPGGTVTTNSLITVGLATANGSGGGFSFPNITDAAALARLGPNLIVQAGPPTVPTAVPISPLALGIIGVGLTLMAAALIGLRRPVSGGAL